MAVDRPRLDATRALLLDRIDEAVAETKDPTRLLKLAEAYAWVAAPGAGHGSGTDPSS